MRSTIGVLAFTLSTFVANDPSIKGERHRNGVIIHTLHVLPMANDAKNVEQGVYETNGVQVELWTDQLLIYSLAHGQ